VTIARAFLCLGIIVAGLTLRSFGLGLGIPAAIVKYGGSILWGAMVFFLVAVAFPSLSRLRIAGISAVIAVGVELFRPWLDAFRLTLAGALLLGRIFSAWDILAYGAGIWLAMLLDYLTVAALTEAIPPHSPS
jgi:hypothetical protein